MAKNGRKWLKILAVNLDITKKNCNFAIRKILRKTDCPIPWDNKKSLGKLAEILRKS